MIPFRRIKQIFKFGWLHAGQVSEESGKNRFSVFVDILKCFFKYRMWSNQYLKNRFWALSKMEREQLGTEIRKAGEARDLWQKRFISDRNFFLKYGDRKYERSDLRDKRRKAYTKYFNMGEGCKFEYDVEFGRQHYLPGILTVGNNVLFAKHVFIDYSGEIIIHDGVRIANGVIIESHHRDIDALKDGKDINIPSRLEIGENAYIGSRAIILDSCNYIGRNVRIGAGAVVTKDIPDNSVAVGVPAKVVRTLDV